MSNTENTESDNQADGAPSLGTRDKNPNFKWYVVHTYSMFEEKAKQSLLDRVRLNKMDGKFGDIIVPKTAMETVLKSGKKKKVERNAFPGYIIVEMEMDENTNHLVRETPKITGFVGNARNPRPITDQEVLRLTSPETLKEQSKQQAATQSFEKGETVKVIDGAFTNFDGVVEAVQADKMKLRILVSIFGRETPVELDYGQVQKLS
jgi:transcriptional antiterminator NusG